MASAGSVSVSHALITALVLLTAAALAQSPASAPAPAPGADCSAVVLNAADCLSFVQPGGNATKPDPNCCSELAGLLKSNPICLCKLVTNPASLGFNIDVGRAVGLPAACKLSTPSLTLCSAAAGPAPASSESPSSPSGGGAVAPAAGTPAGQNSSDCGWSKMRPSLTAASALAFLPPLFL